MTDDEKETSTDRRPSREEALKEAAIEVFSRRGFHDAKVSEIVDEVGVAKGTFYQYYDSKEQLFREILSDFLGMVLETIANWEPRALDSREALRDELQRVGLELTRLLRDHRGLTTIFFTETS
ncbi:MAG: TetR/AcrR family transcriptional regulator, partial [Bradymonadaceae bacterium]